MKISFRKSQAGPRSDDFIAKCIAENKSLDVRSVKTLLVDPKDYYDKNKDVELANMCPFEHFFNSGRMEGRPYPNVGKLESEKQNVSTGNKVVFLIDEKSKVKLAKYFCKNTENLEFINVSELNKSSFIFSVTPILSAGTVISLTPSGLVADYMIDLANSLGCKVNLLSRFEQQLLLNLCKANSSIHPSAILSVLIDEERYATVNPDLVGAKTSAVHHFFNHGINEKRAEPYPGLSVAHLIDLPENTLFLSNAGSTDGSYKYRCEFPSQEKESYYTLCNDDSILKIIETLFKVNKLIFSRPEQRYLNRYIIELAKALGIEVVFDYDDLLLPDYSHKLGHVRSLVSSYTSSFRTALSKLAYIHYADGFVLSTSELAKQFEVYGRPVTVSNNKLPLSFFSMPSRETQEQRKLNFIYLSGTATHKRDFLTINSLLLKLAQNHGDKFTLTFLGNFQANIEIFRQMGVECKAIPRVTFSKMLDVIENADVALVPLENSIFNNCKSNIKYIECASRGVPVVASKVSEFEAAISHGQNGWLCDSQQNWYETLVHILALPKEQIAQIGKNSFDLAKSKYSLKEAK